MRTGKTRVTALLLVIATICSLMTLPALAAGENGTDSASGQSNVTNLMLSDSSTSEEVTTEVPEVDVIEIEPAAPAETTEPAETPLPTETAESAETAETEDTASDELPAPSEEAERASDEPAVDGGEGWTVRYYSGSTLISQESVEDGETPVSVPLQNGSGTAINGWLTADGDSGRFVTAAKAVITADTDFYAWYAPALETAKHIRYINGTGNACFEPEETLTRAQAATLLYNLMKNKTKGSFSAAFTDVTTGDWFYDAVSTLASWKVLTGDGDGTFRPNDNITRAEFVTMVVRLHGIENRQNTFADVSGHWAEDSVATAAYHGWVNGYDKDTFLPGNSIKRAEAVTILNRYLNRSADESKLADGYGILAYLDVDEDEWYYPQVMEASIGHEYTAVPGGEQWTTYNIESCGLTAGSHDINGQLVWVDSETLQLVKFNDRIVKADTHYLYTRSNGFYYAADLTELDQSSNFKTGIKRVEGTLFYWDANTRAPKLLSAGINDLGYTYGYYADKDGYVIRNDYGSGVVELNGKKYLAYVSNEGKSNSTSSIITKYYSYINKEWTDAKNKTYEYDGNHNMYYIQSDYSLMCDDWYGYLYFGPDGNYTTGDTKLDGYIYSFVSSALNNNSLTSVQKLLKVYYSIRGGDGKSYSGSQFSYRQTGMGYVYGSYTDCENYDWVAYSAKEFYEKKSGMCYNWACFYLFCARRLGFQCYPVVGTIFNTNNYGSRHCWCMIKWNNTWHISDVEVEWGYIARYYTGGSSVYWNLFDQVYSGEYKYTNPECTSIVYRFRTRSEDSQYL